MAKVLGIPEGAAQHEIRHTLTGYARPAWVTFGTKWEDSAETLKALQVAVSTIWTTRLGPNYDTNVTLTLIRSHGRDSSGDLFMEETPLSTAGATVGETVPPNSALLVRKLTGRAGRTERGRMYVPWLNQEANVDETGQITGATVTALQAKFDLVKSDLDARANDSRLLLLHTHFPGLPIPPGTIISSLVVDPRIATQRRRLRS